MNQISTYHHIDPCSPFAPIAPGVPGGPVRPHEQINGPSLPAGLAPHDKYLQWAETIKKTTE